MAVIFDRHYSIQPEKDIVVEFIKNEEFKYVHWHIGGLLQIHCTTIIVGYAIKIVPATMKSSTWTLIVMSQEMKSITETETEVPEKDRIVIMMITIMIPEGGIR